MLDTALLVIYFAVIGGLAVYGINCYVLLLCRRSLRRQLVRSREIREAYNRETADADLPTVTVQLPVFNERFVVGRLLHAVGQLDYPADKLEIQVLDDSTDDTTDIARGLVDAWRARGLDIRLIHRDNREGYKAGALDAGQQVAKGELIAIFDADFTPRPDFLRSTVPFFTDPQVGLVQARWGHFNDRYSWLTRAQAIAIDGHFGIEQGGRNWGGVFMNFNGTAGIWRRSSIDDSGGWEHDTLTEDLDLSYRAQLRGWKIEFLPEIEVPAEIPANIPAFKSQQRRWAKGSTQTLLKLWRRVLGAPLPLFTKVQSLIHISHYFIHPLMLLMAVLAWPLLHVWDTDWVGTPSFVVVLVLTTLSTLGPSIMYLAGQMTLRKDWMQRFLHLPVLLVVGMGIAVSNTRAVLEGLIGIRSGFVRTPKESLTGSGRSVSRAPAPRNRYRLPVDPVFIVEAGLCVYCALSMKAYIEAGRGLFAPYLLIYTVGFGTMALATLRDMLSRLTAESPAEDVGTEVDVLALSADAWAEAMAAWTPADAPGLATGPAATATSAPDQPDVPVPELESVGAQR